MNKIIIIGSGGHAMSCTEIINEEKKYKIAGYIIKEKSNTFLNNSQIIGFDQDLEKLRKKFKYAFIGIGQIKSNKGRLKILDKLIKYNYTIPKIISPKSIISKNSNIGLGTMIMHNVILNYGSKIGNNCIINTNTLIEHGVSIADNSHISTGVIINGNSQIGKNTFIGSGVIVHEGISIGENSIISAGKIIKKNIKKNSLIK